jgi:hypothetical protein
MTMAPPNSKFFSCHPFCYSTYNDKNDGVFGSCKSLSEVTFQSPSKVQKFGYKVFILSSLERITLPASVISISSETFRICNKLESIDVEDGNTKYSSKNGVLLTKDGKNVVYYPNKAVQGETIILPEGVTSIGKSSFIGIHYKYIDLTGITKISESGFDRFEYLVEVEIPETVTVLNKKTFIECSRLISVSFKGTYTTFPTSLFESCAALETFHIPSGTENIGDYCFYKCSNLKKVYIPKSVTMIGTCSFSLCNESLEFIFEEGSTISYTANGYLYNSEKTKLILYLGTSESVVIIPSVNTICNGAFKGKTITSITYESKETITTIENGAFMDCVSIVSLELPPNIEVISNNLFCGCSSLTSISIPSGVTSIKESAFKDCTSLSSVTFSSNVNEIGVECFCGCSNLKSISLPDSLTKISKMSFKNCGIEVFRIPTSLTVIEEYAFDGSSLKKIEFPDNPCYANIGRLSFSGARELESVSFPDYIESIGESSFSLCTGLVNITIGQSIKDIQDKAFLDCVSLDKVVIGNNMVLSTIHSSSFEGCTSLKSFDVNDGINNFYFSTGILFNYDQTEIIIFLKATKERHIVIPDNVTTINSYAFSNSESIETVTFSGAGIEKISPYAFYNCMSLRTINFPSSLQSIGSFSFHGCNIESLHLGASVLLTELPDSVFSNNKKLTQIVIPPSIKNISTTAFEHVHNNAYVIYLGSNEIKNSVGFGSASRAIVTDLYEFNYFAGIKVIRNMRHLCTIKHNSVSIMIIKKISMTSLLITVLN